MSDGKKLFDIVHNELYGPPFEWPGDEWEYQDRYTQEAWERMAWAFFDYVHGLEHEEDKT